MNSNIEASTITVNTKTPTTNFPPPKTDKPRPHVCTTCQRAFARLEHLKRHERSHTKEKPFECGDCKRCFARRDLLLRHQQKLHQSTTPSARPRNRRESASGTTTAAQSRARKNSVASANPAAAQNQASMRPRANTISTIDPIHMQQYMAGVPSAPRMPPTHSRHPSLMGLQSFHQNNFDNSYSGMAAAMGQRGMPSNALRLETHGLPFEAGPITAPVHHPWFRDYSFGTGTINPSMLHDSSNSPPLGPISPAFTGIPDVYDSFGIDSLAIANSQTPFQGFYSNNRNDSAVLDGSSSSAISTASPGGMSDAMIDGSNNIPMTTSQWAPSLMSPHSTAFGVDFTANHGFPDLLSGSPHPMQSHVGNENFFTPPPSNPSSLQDFSFLAPSQMDQFAVSGPKTPSSINGINNSGTSPVATITDSTRNAILGALSSPAAQNSTLASRKPSFSLKSSPFSPHAASPTSASDDVNTLPSTQDLQRYVTAYIICFHPHLPFIHIPTLSFEVPKASSDGKSSHIGGPACLVLSMAAIGALYEGEQDQAHKLFEFAKKMIQAYLDQRRKATVRKAYAPDQDMQEGADTPVWLVQSMLLNVVFGHNCADKLAGEIASTHTAALSSLARGADLYSRPADQDNSMSDADEQSEWLHWKNVEERKRTFYAIFILSSLLVSAYNHSPTLTNPEIVLDLPCDEAYFEAEDSAAFAALGGKAGASRGRTSFQDAFLDLMRTHEKQVRQRRMSTHTGQRFGTASALDSSELPQSSLQPSAFGSLILIHSIHNFLWETRQRHHNKAWTPEETDKLHRVIEPALRAWLAAWEKGHHSKATVSVDALPMLQLAHVRLFVNLGRSKERFWQRDWQGLAEELRRGSEITQHADPPAAQPTMDERMDMTVTGLGNEEMRPHQFSTDSLPANLGNDTMMSREKLLRKAASFAAKYLSQAHERDLSLADMTNRGLSLQHCMCTFDCAQVVAEWIATLQDRVGQYLGGVLGRDEINVFEVPAIMFLDDVDTDLLLTVQRIMSGWEKRLGMETMSSFHGGYAVKLLKVTAYTFGKAEVWPGKFSSQPSHWYRGC